MGMGVCWCVPTSCIASSTVCWYSTKRCAYTSWTYCLWVGMLCTMSVCMCPDQQWFGMVVICTGKVVIGHQTLWCGQTAPQCVCVCYHMHVNLKSFVLLICNLMCVCLCTGNGSQFLALSVCIILMALLGMFNVHRYGSLVPRPIPRLVPRSIPRFSINVSPGSFPSFHCVTLKSWEWAWGQGSILFSVSCVQWNCSVML